MIDHTLGPWIATLPQLTDADLEDIKRRTRHDIVYWTELGHFLERFALLEAALFGAIVSQFKVTRDAAIALMGGDRTDGMIGRLRQAWKLNPMDHQLRRDAVACLDQLSAINTFRNTILHYGATLVDDDTGERRATNESRRKKGAANVYRVSPDILREAIADLAEINTRLQVERIPLPPDEAYKVVGQLPPWRFHPR